MNVVDSTPTSRSRTRFRVLRGGFEMVLGGDGELEGILMWLIPLLEVMMGDEMSRILGRTWPAADFALGDRHRYPPDICLVFLTALVNRRLNLKQTSVDRSSMASK